MKKEAINELSTADLMERIEERRLEYVKMKLNHAVSPLDNPHKLGACRKEIARMMTELRKREMMENKNDNK
ncbi:MAG: 50S ribosomal protein L29 [Bacteroidales bacterium]|nr:50S ribosomal protein L29 [Lentimicrobiaceae bacterium]MBQ2906214.1 50S ribosomal protein L29 [Bacteroidales bacterium]MBQ3595319.1 50S ribosomal protein L29 [Bacteroidales bacterium]MBR3915347.1 50S ribosomal protein L29 [Bacteroidales bacterium]